MKKANLNEVAKELRTQDNLTTSDPIFMVQEEIKEFGIDQDYGEDGHVWVDECDGEEAEVEDVKRCELAITNFERIPNGFRRVGYRTRWENRQPFFTRKGAEEHLRVNGHNYQKTRIYVECAFRNAEWQAIREILMKKEDCEFLTKEIT